MQLNEAAKLEQVYEQARRLLQDTARTREETRQVIRQTEQLRLANALDQPTAKALRETLLSARAEIERLRALHESVLRELALRLEAFAAGSQGEIARITVQTVPMIAAVRKELRGQATEERCEGD